MECRYISRWLQGEFKSEHEMVEKLKYAIHDFTRRQLTWFRRDKRIVWVENGNVEKAEAGVRRCLGRTSASRAWGPARRGGEFKLSGDLRTSKCFPPCSNVPPLRVSGLP